MHELAVTESILRIAEKHAEQAEAKKVTDLYLVIGALSSIVDDSVVFYWEMLAQGTVCEGSTIHFKRLPAKMLCLACENIFELSGELIPCPNCSSFQLKIQSGEEFWLESIEIER
ncbi:MAG: hydrogenase maturation nickel metallochaperone HypA [Anaerolineaceae bacterium]|nr:hydrogenase maturation nickel metallochaperone HypA [Anaerolineaceae bacterium]